MEKINKIFDNLKNKKITVDKAQQQILNLFDVSVSLPDFIKDRDLIINNYIKWQGDNFEKCDRLGLLQSGFREGVKYAEWEKQGMKYRGQLSPYPNNFRYMIVQKHNLF